MKKERDYIKCIKTAGGKHINVLVKVDLENNNKLYCRFFKGKKTLPDYYKIVIPANILENNKFKEVIVYAYYEGGKIMEEQINLPLRRINKQIVAQYIEKANKKAKKQLQKEFNRPFKHLTEEEKEKVYLHWYIMQPINKTEEEKIKEFSSLIRENSRIDDHYNIIFNA